MNTNKHIWLILFMLTFTLSCKKDNKIESLELIQHEFTDSSFKVTLDVIVKKDDDFSLYFTDDGSIDFSQNPPIWVGVRGKETSQKVYFILPKEVRPTQLRLDFGLNQEQPDIILENVTLEFMGKSRTIGRPELVSFFRADETKCTFDHISGVIKALDNEGKKLSPSLYPHESNLFPEIDKLF